MTNKLIVLEGIDGVGKTTIAKLLKKELSQRGIRAVRYEERERSTEGFNAIKPFIKQQAPLDASLLFYIASSIYKSQRIEKLLKKNWVICDRYIYSTLAYHKVRGAHMSLVADLRKLPIRLPDFFFLLSVREDVRMKRVRAKKDHTPADMLPKKKGSFVAKMENVLNEFEPAIVDNTRLHPHLLAREMAEMIFPRQSEKKKRL